MTSDLDTVRISSITDLITGIPGMLGFIPDRSVVIITADAVGRMGMSLRHDLTMIGGQPSPQMLAGYRELAALISSSNPDKVIACVVDDRFEPSSPGYLHLCATLHRHLIPVGGLTSGYAVTDITPGTRVHGVWGERSGLRLGTLADPELSPVAISHTVAGRSLHRHRRDLVAELSPQPHCAEPGCSYAPYSLPEWFTVNHKVRRIEKVTMGSATLRTIREVDPDGATCAQLRAVEESLAVVDVRDVLVGCAVTLDKDAAARWWTALTRRLQGPGKSTAATLLGHLLYANRDGTRAGIALEIATGANDANNLAHHLVSALSAGMHPREMGILAEYSRDLADELGLQLAPADEEYDWEV